MFFELRTSYLAFPLALCAQILLESSDSTHPFFGRPRPYLRLLWGVVQVGILSRRRVSNRGVEQKDR